MFKQNNNDDEHLTIDDCNEPQQQRIAARFVTVVFIQISSKHSSVKKLF